MALPFLTRDAQSPQVHYRPDCPPPIPNVIGMSREMMDALPVLTSEVANYVTGEAMANPLRMFVFNMLSSLNWQNSAFAELVTLTSQFLQLQLEKRNISNLYQAMPATIGQMASCWTANKLFEYPELKSEVSNDIIQSAMTNLGLFNSIKTEIAAMSNGQQYDPRNDVRFDPRYQVQPGGVYQGQNAQPPMHGGGYVDQRFNTMRSDPVVTYQPKVASPNLGHRALDQRAAFSIPQEVVRNEPPRVITEADWKASPRAPYKTLVNTNLFETKMELVKVANNEYVDEVIYIKGVEELERSKHTLLISINTQPKVRAVNLEVAATSMNAIAKTIAATPDVERENIDYTRYIFPDEVLVDDLNQAFYSIRLKKAEVSGHDVFACRFVVENNIPSFDSCKDILISLSNSGSFIDIANYLSNERELCKGKEFLKDMTEITIRNTNNRLEYIARIDKYLTNMVNDFFAVNLTLTKFSIDSFIDDIKEVIPGLNKYYGNEFVHLYSGWQQFTISRLFIDSESIDLFSDVEDVNEPNLVVNQMLPVSYNLVYVDRYLSELGLEASDEAKRVDERYTPEIHKLIKAAFDSEFGFGLKALNTVLLTKDSVALELFKGYLGNNVFLCRRHRQF